MRKILNNSNKISKTYHFDTFIIVILEKDLQFGLKNNIYLERKLQQNIVIDLKISIYKSYNRKEL